MKTTLAITAAAAVVAVGGWIVWTQMRASQDETAMGRSPPSESHRDEGAHEEVGHEQEGAHEADGLQGEGHEETGPEHKAGAVGEHASEANVISLTLEQRGEAGIVVEIVQLMPLPKVFRAPGEVRTNDYSTNVVTARHPAIITERKAKLGDKVTKGQALVGLFSAEMAEAQTAYILAEQEYRRVRQLGESIVSARRYAEANGKRRETRAKLETFGLGPAEIDALSKKGGSDHPAGQFEIVAPQDGDIVSDDFRIGEVVELGKVLFVITDPANVWIEAHVGPSVAPEIVGDTAKIHLGDKTIDARVIQVQRQVDESTRTIGVRLQATNTEGLLKPGLFVDVELYGKSELVMSLPTEAIVRGPDGDWTIYVENAKGEFEPKEVEILYTVGDRTAILGIEPGAKAVTRGAFFVMAEAAKAGFDPHNH